MDASGDGASRLKAFVRSRPDDESLTVSLVLAGRQRHLNRPKAELLEKCLARIKTNAMPKESKKDRKKNKSSGSSSMEDSRDDIVNAMTAGLFYDYQMTRPIELALPNGGAWMEAKALQVGAELFDIEVNPPTVDKVQIIKRAMVSFPLLPVAQLSFAVEEESSWQWSRLPRGSKEWQELGCTEQVYCPVEEDVGCKLRVQVTPRRGVTRVNGDGPTGVVGQAEFVETGVVSAAPTPTSASLRCPEGQLPTTSSPELRIMSYNILADQYAGSTFAQNVLFDYCPPECLEPEYRKQLVLKELLMYSPDIVCLQEVDEKVFVDCLLPFLSREGFAGRYTNKMGKVKEGSATFWRESRFKLASCKDVLLRDVFKQPLDASHAHWNVMLDASKELTKALQKVTTVAQVTVLEPTSTSSSQETPIVVMNTHLFFHPYAPHIRNMHTAAILEEAWALIQGLALEKEPAIMFVGDLNSDLNDGIPGVVELLQSGKLAPDFWDWDMGAAFKWGMDEEEGTEEQQASAPKPPGSKLGQAAAEVAAADSSGSGAEEVLDAATSTLPTESSTTNSTPLSVPKHNVPVVGIEVQMPFGALRSADDLATPYTNYTSGYKALLDYVWFQDNKMEVLKSVPVPSVETLGGFIPNSLFPSDHLAVVYDLKFKDKS